ncbi:MAG TPA: squalene/phytoene synthase family protein [Chloroflexota bacterium]|nr:squalene/phytoene synthase family protein [Chloroflexota bacterium]
MLRNGVVPDVPIPTPVVAPQPALEADARYCRDLTRREAANFYWGFVALPRRQRIAIYALYSFARQIDDDVDLARAGSEEAATRLAKTIALHRERVHRCYAGRADDPVMRLLAEVVAECAIPRSELEELIDGVEMDLVVTSYESWEDLERYCRLVAATVGRMCVRIFGFTESEALHCADDLGVAMQLTNILRDVGEDRDRGRVYLPQADLRRFGLTVDHLHSPRPRGWEPLVRFEVARAAARFESGCAVTSYIPRRAGVCVNTMAGIYQAVLQVIAREPHLPLEGRVLLSRRTKLSVMMKSWLKTV